MSLEIPESLSAEEWKKLPDNQKPIFRQKQNDPNTYEYAVVEFHNSMKNAKSERDDLRTELESVKSQISAYKQFGDPEELRQLKEREQVIMDSTATLEEQIRRANDEARQREAENVKKLTQERDTYKNGLADYAKRNKVELMVKASGIDPDYEEEAINAAMSAIHAELRDGKPVLSVMENGSIARDPDTGDPMSPERWFQSYRTRKAKLFRGDSGDASGSNFDANRGTGSGALEDKDPLTWSTQEKMEFQRKHGANFQPAYSKLMHAWNAKRDRERKKA